MTELRDDDRTALVRDGWRVGSDQRWRNDRFGGAYKTENALRRIGSKRGEPTRPMDDEETARFLKGYAAGANDMEAGRLVTSSGFTADEQSCIRFWMEYAAQIHGDADAVAVKAKLSLIANGETDD